MWTPSGSLPQKEHQRPEYNPRHSVLGKVFRCHTVFWVSMFQEHTFPSRAFSGPCLGRERDISRAGSRHARSRKAGSRCTFSGCKFLGCAFPGPCPGKGRGNGRAISGLAIRCCIPISGGEEATAAEEAAAREDVTRSLVRVPCPGRGRRTDCGRNSCASKPAREAATRWLKVLYTICYFY